MNPETPRRDQPGQQPPRGAAVRRTCLDGGVAGRNRLGERAVAHSRDRRRSRSAHRRHPEAGHRRGEAAEALYGAPYLQMHRADLHRALLSAVPKVLSAWAEVGTNLADWVEAATEGSDTWKFEVRKSRQRFETSEQALEHLREVSRSTQEDHDGNIKFAFRGNDLNTEIFDYAKVQVDTEVLAIINHLHKVVYPYQNRDNSIIP